MQRVDNIMCVGLGVVLACGIVSGVAAAQESPRSSVGLEEIIGETCKLCWREDFWVADQPTVQLHSKSAAEGSA